MHVGFLENWLTYLNIGGAGALIARMYWEKLAGIYRMLVVYLAAGALEDVFTMVFAGDNRARYLVYAAGQTVKVTVAIFVARELFRLALTQQPALAHWGKRAIGYFFGLAAAAAAFYISIESVSRAATAWWLVGQFLAFEGAMDLAVLVILVLMSVFLLWFPVRARRNAAICIAGFVVYYFQRWTGLLLVARWPHSRQLVSPILLGVSFLCLAGWVVLLKRQGEYSTVTTGHRWNPLEAARLTAQLDAINSRLDGAASR
jgi:hypothetical protein